MDFLALGVGALAAAMLVAGLTTGRMPNAMIEPSRVENPVGFWAMGMLYAAITVGCFMIALCRLI